MDQPATPASQPLQYATSQGRRELGPARQTVWFRFTIWCWAVPLVLGTMTFLLWLIVRWRGLAIFGIYVILFGIAVTIIGGICVLVLFVTRWTTSNKFNRQALFPSLALIALLLSNFAVALFLMNLAHWIDPDVLGHHGLP